MLRSKRYQGLLVTVPGMALEDIAVPGRRYALVMRRPNQCWEQHRQSGRRRHGRPRGR